MRRTTKSINGMMSSWHCFSTSSLISVNQFPRCGAYIQAQCAIDLSKVTGRAAGLAAPVLCGPVADLINTSLLTSASAHPARPENFDTATGRRLSAHYLSRRCFPASSSELSSGVTSISHCRRLHPRYISSTSSPSGPRALLLLPSLLCSRQLSSELYVIVISLDFSKAFDTVRHSSLLHKLAQLNIYIYNWLAN